MGDILYFPERQSRRIQSSRNQESRRLAYSGALLSIFVLMMAMQIQLETQYDGVAMAHLDERYSPKGERAIASMESTDQRAQRLNEDEIFVKQLNALAPDLNESVRRPSSIGHSCQGPVCVFGPNYRLIYQGQGLKGAELADGLIDDGIRGLPWGDEERLLMKLKGSAAVPFDRIEKKSLSSREVSSAKGISVWALFSAADDQASGFAVFEESGEQIRSLVFCSGQPQAGAIQECLSEIR